MIEAAETAIPFDLQAGGARQRADTPADRVRKARASSRKCSLPKPRSAKLAPLKFFKWFEAFTPEQIGRSILHLYRDHPVIDLRLIGNMKPKLIKQFDQIPIPFPAEQWEDYFLKQPEWGGSGEYKVLCTEVGVNGCVCLTKFTLDNAEYPPCIDLKSLVLGHPLNKGYEATLRASHIRIPGDDPKADQEDHDMQVGNTVVGQLAEQLTRSNERLMDKLDQAQEDQQPDNDEVIEQNATAAAVSVVAEGAKEAIKLVGEQARHISQAASPFNPMEFLKEAAPLFRGNGNDAAGMTGMFKMFLDSHEKSVAAVQAMHERTLDFMREQHEERREVREEQAAVSVASQPQSGFDTFLEQGKKMREVGELFGWESGRRRREPEAEPAPAAPWYQAWASNPTLVLTGLSLFSNIVYNMFNRGNGKPPQEALKEAQQQVAELTKGGAQPSTPPPDPEEQRKRSLLAFLDMIEPSFITHYFDREDRGLDGFTFAEALMTMRQNLSNGQITLVPDGPATDLGASQYEAIKAGGIEHFDRTIRNYHPIWSLVQGNIGKYTTFLKQFFSFQEEAARRANEQPN